MKKQIGALAGALVISGIVLFPIAITALVCLWAINILRLFE